MKETDLIQALRRHLKVSPDQRQAVFAADAEIVEADGRTIALTLDEFSDEDGFSPDDPRLLGWNLVTATLSDLLAVGARPRYMLNSFVAGPDMDSAFLETFSAGLEDALSSFGAFMLGGDAGSAGSWRFTGVGLGTFETGARPCSRLTTLDRGVVMATGAFGDGNLAAGGAAPGARLECRLDDARRLFPWLERGEVACIDTSDGLGRALEILAELNPQLRMVIELDRVCLAEGVKKTADKMSIPPETFLLASAGEYELLALVPEAAILDLEAESDFSPIGRFESQAGSGLFYQRSGARGGAELIGHQPLPDPRDARDSKEYQARIIAHAAGLFESE